MTIIIFIILIIIIQKAKFQGGRAVCLRPPATAACYRLRSQRGGLPSTLCHVSLTTFFFLNPFSAFLWFACFFEEKYFSFHSTITFRTDRCHKCRTHRSARARPKVCANTEVQQVCDLFHLRWLARFVWPGGERWPIRDTILLLLFSQYCCVAEDNFHYS